MIDALMKIAPELGLHLEKRALPTPKVGEVLIRPLLTALNQKDAAHYKWDSRAQAEMQLPFVAGHEFVGEVIAVGAGVTALEPQERVTAYLAAPGCFAEAFCLPAASLFTLPETFPLQRALLLSTVAVAAEALWQRELKGRALLITGAGPLGLAAVLLAKQAGAEKITVTDSVEARLALAKLLGAHETVNSAKERLSFERAPTVGFEMSGSPHALSTQIAALAPGSVLTLVGVMPSGFSPDFSAIQDKDLTVAGFHPHAPQTLFSKLLPLASEPLATHLIPYREYASAYDLLLRGEAGKILLDWREAPALILPREEAV